VTRTTFIKLELSKTIKEGKEEKEEKDTWKIRDRFRNLSPI